MDRVKPYQRTLLEPSVLLTRSPRAVDSILVLGDEMATGSAAAYPLMAAVKHRVGAFALDLRKQSAHPFELGHA